jgi:hypothetical protein
MAELILNNLPIVLFVVITIAVRILQARAKARRTEAPPVFASSLEPDDENEEAEDRAEPEALIYGARPGEFSAPAGKPAATRRVPKMAEVDRPRFEALPGLSVHEGPAVYPVDSEPLVREAENNTSAFPGMKKNAVPAITRKEGNAFPRLQQYTLPQRAMVWAEILGKPKGME